MMGGAISHAVLWDFKETRLTPKDIDAQQFTSDIFPQTLFPRASEYVDKISLVRSMRANELIHFIGQYHTQTGRALMLQWRERFRPLAALSPMNWRAGAESPTPFHLHQHVHGSMQWRHRLRLSAHPRHRIGSRSDHGPGFVRR